MSKLQHNYTQTATLNTYSSLRHMSTAISYIRMHTYFRGVTSCLDALAEVAALSTNPRLSTALVPVAENKSPVSKLRVIQHTVFNSYITKMRC